MKNKLAMFAGAYVFATITAGVYMYKKMTELKQQRDNQFNALELLSKNYEEKHQQLLKECDELKEELKNKNNSKRVDMLRHQLAVNEENWQHLFKGYEEQRDRADKSDKLVKELKHVQNIRKMELFTKLSEKDSEILKLEAEIGRLNEINKNLEQDIGDAQLTIQDQDLEINSLQAIIADYEEISRAKAAAKL